MIQYEERTLHRHHKTAAWEVRQTRRNCPSQWPWLPVYKLCLSQGACNKRTYPEPQRHCSLLWQRSYGELLCHTEKRKAVSDTYIPNEARRGQDHHLQIHLRLLQYAKDQQLQWRRSPTCGTKEPKAALSSRCLISAYPRFWVFSDCTFLDNSILSKLEFGYTALFLLLCSRFSIPSWLVFALLSGKLGY